MKPSTSKTETESIQKSLAKPGAGIPLIAQIINRIVVKPFRIRPTPWDECEGRFRSAHEAFLRELADFPHEKLTERVLVPPQRGLEDSSRYWSAAMTARHLVIVGQGMERIILALSRGEKVPVKANTALVKPEEALNAPEQVEAYRRFGDGALERIHAQVVDRASKATHVHPWFGAMTAKDWFWLMGAHTRIHLKQLRNIRAGLT